MLDERHITIGEPESFLEARMLRLLRAHGLPEGSAEHGVDTEHEEVAYRFLERHFGEQIAESIRMHVAAITAVTLKAFHISAQGLR